MNTAPLWTATDAARATGGTASSDWNVQGISIDSRDIAQGDLFVALKGPNFDGHDFVAAALAAGAGAAMVTHQPNGTPTDAPLLTVGDTLDGLRALATAARDRTKAKIVAITGSVGKTGTKEALSAALAAQGNTSASARSLNNHWGVPLSLARLPPDADFGVFEVGMNHPGEIEPLSRLLRPDVAIVTTVAPAHIGNFNSLEEVADAKAEIFAGMSGGSAILNRDNDLFERLSQAAQAAGITNIIGFGKSDAADARLLDWTLDNQGANVDANVCNRHIAYRLSLPGRHQVINSLSVLAACCALGADIAVAARALSEIAAMAGRGERHLVRLVNGSLTLIDESYNANPASMGAAIEMLADTRPGPCGRHIAVLGDMHELGARSTEFHAALANVLAEHGIERVYACGEEMAAMINRLPPAMRGTHAATSRDIANDVVRAAAAGDVIMIKGSLASGMRCVVDALLALDHEPDAAANG
ncbi:MAG: UDP-N-acetylmuramoylalanyl-D-glutamyl-2,6-diaminopimelate--D-alanyl-D-alanine ligase [Alphaproteobacteria bacterium]